MTARATFLIMLTTLLLSLTQTVAAQGVMPSDAALLPVQYGQGRCDWNEAREHIDWVLNDRRARRTMEEAIRQQGLSPYQAVLYAQNHSLEAQSAIDACRRRSENYIENNYRPAVASCNWNEARSHIDWVLNDRRGRQAMEDGLRRGLSRYDAVLYAQSHDSNIQNTINACQRQASRYIDDNYRPAVASCDWNEARKHIDWVLNDRRARRTMDDAVNNRGMDPYRAVLYTQNHNPDAQRVIQACGREARSYIDQRYASSGGYPGGDPVRPDDRCRWDEARRHIDWVFDNPQTRKQVQDDVYYNAASPYDAVMAAQSHSLEAQRTIQDCYSRSKQHIERRFAKYRL